jgi:hypothetical protein
MKNILQSDAATTMAATRFLPLIEALVFCGYVGWYIWRLQTSIWSSWVIFPVWLIGSFFIYRDTPKSLGWRADNFWSATKHSAAVFSPFIAGLCLVGVALGGWHRPSEHLLVPNRLFGYLAFCLLQQVGLNSLVTNRLLAAMENPVHVSLLAGTIFAALHWPNPVLVPLTWIGGTAMSWLFARERNILPLAVGQGILGTLVWWAFPVAWHHAMRVGPGYFHFQVK